MRFHRTLIITGLLLASTIPARAADPVPTTDDEKTIYALGLVMAQKLAPFDLKGTELDILVLGLKDALTHAKAKVELKDFGPKIQTLAQQRIEVMGKLEIEQGKLHQDKMAAEAGATRSDTGLIMRTLKPGTGKSPTKEDRVKVHYHGTLRDGFVFDSSVERGQPMEIPLTDVMPCWQEALPKMKVGEKAKVTCPAAIAYGDGGNPPAIKPGATLTFEIELLDVLPPGPAAPAGAAPAPAPGK